MNTVTKEEVMANMRNVVCRTEEVFGKPVTHVSVRMKNGFVLHETTTCVDPKNYDERIGRRICLQRIEEKIWFLLGYVLQDRLTSESKEKPSEKKPEKDLSGTVVIPPDMIAIPRSKYKTLLARSEFLKKLEEETEKDLVDEVIDPCGDLDQVPRIPNNGRVIVVDLSNLIK
jgi:hypothetical protein